jgi:hypothetical protein
MASPNARVLALLELLQTGSTWTVADLATVIDSASAPRK